MTLGPRRRLGLLVILAVFELFTAFRLVEVLVRYHRNTGVFWSAWALILVVFLIVLLVMRRLRRGL